MRGRRNRLGSLLALGIVVGSLASAPPGHAAPRQRVRAASDAGLVLRYAFDSDNGGAVRDTSSSGLNGRLVNGDLTSAHVSSVPGRGKAIHLVGQQHQYVDVPRSSALNVNRFTLSALVRYTGVQNDATLGRWEVMEKADAYWLNIRTDGHVRTGGFFGGCGGGSAWKFLDSTTTVPTNTWTQLTSTYDGSTLAIWIDGQRVGTRSVTGTTCVNDQPLTVGAKNAPAHGLLEAFWDGDLDAVRVYNRALSAAEIRALVP